MIQFKHSKWLACLFLFLLPIMLGICCPYPVHGGSQGYGWCPSCGRDMPDSHFPHGGGGGGEGGGGYGGYTPRLSPQEQQARAANREGLQYDNNGDYVNAIKLYRKAHNLSPNDVTIRKNLAGALNDRGVQLHDKKDYEGALSFYEESFKFNPHHKGTGRNIRVAKGHILNRNALDFFENGDYDTAISYFEDSIRINPEDQTARGNLAEARRRMREQAESSRLEEQREQKRKEDDRLEEQREQRRKEEDRLAKAMEKQKLKEATQRVNNMLVDLTKKLGASTGTSKSSKSSGLSLMGPAGTRLFEKGSKDSAPVDLRLMPLNKPLVVNPEDVKGGTPSQTKNSEEILTRKQNTDKLVDKEALKHKHVGDFLLQRGEYDDAEKELLQAPEDEETRQSLLDLYSKQIPQLIEEDRLEEAYVQLSKAIALNPNDAGLRKKLDEFGLALGYPSLSEGEQSQTQSSGKQAAIGSKGEISQEPLKLIKFQGMVPEKQPGGAATTPTMSGEDANSGAINRLQAIADAARGDGHGFDGEISGKPLQSGDIPVVKGIPVDTQDYIVPEHFKEQEIIVELANEFNLKNKVIKEYENKLEQIKKVERNRPRKSNENRAEKTEIEKKIAIVKEEKKLVVNKLQEEVKRLKFNIKIPKPKKINNSQAQKTIKEQPAGESGKSQAKESTLSE